MLNESLEEDWREMAAGREPGAERKHERAQRIAMNAGFSYTPAAGLAEGPLGEILRRLNYLAINRAGPDVANAILGGIDPPPFRLSALLEAFEQERAPALKAYSPDQVRKWRNTKKAAIENLIEIVGDKPLTDLKRDDALAFRDWWRDRVLAGDVQIGTANKDLGHISKMLRTIEDARRLGIDCDAFARLRLAGEESGQRTAYDPQFVQDVILAEDALDGLNEEARRVVYVCADTGMRLSEIVNLLPHHIHLKAAVPHVEIVAEGRKLKTRHSARKMPLVGCALAAMKLQPEGFPRYRDKAASLSALVNKAMTARGMRPTTDHSLYSLRHTFEDRLTALDPPDKIIAVLMGHKHSRPKYRGEYLREEYLVPLKMSAGALAKRLGVPRTRIERIATEQTGITSDTALRLGKFFKTSPQFWMNMQTAYDLKIEAKAKKEELDKIEAMKVAD